MQISEVEEVELCGDIAFIIAIDQLVMTPQVGGATSRMAGRAIMIARRDAARGWLFHRGLNNMVPSEAESAPSS